MRTFYTISIVCYGLGIWLAALFNRKAARWIQGRRGWLIRLQDYRKDNTSPLIWFHCASLGEFEQGRPLIEKIKETFPHYQILLTFFSPSGYEVRKNYPLAGHVSCLPLDTPRNARAFIRSVRPDMAFFVKYEFWYNFLYILRKENIPVFLASAIFRPRQFFFSWYGKWFRNHLMYLTRIFVQNESSFDLLNRFGIKNVQVSGDTRFDRVDAIAASPERFPRIEQWLAKRRVLIAGSTWPADEDLLLPLIDEIPADLCFMIAPHEVHPERIGSLVDRMGRTAITLTALESSPDLTARILVVDSVGLLAHLYRHAFIVYIGGGFGKGIHNILEAAVFGKPVIFGPNYKRFQEAVDLIGSGGALCAPSARELINATASLLNDPLRYNAAAEAASTYVQAHKGATARILGTIQKFIHP